VRPPGYFIRLENTRTEDDLYLSKRVRMRRWLCCTCQVDESYPSNENEHLKSPGNHVDGGMLPQLSLYAFANFPMVKGEQNIRTFFFDKYDETFLLIWFW
jgi:hypothetical protein